MYPHRIRLRGPWTLKTAAGTIVPVKIDDGSNAARLDPTAVPSPVQLCRRFSWLARLQAHERLWLVLERSAVTSCALNGMALGLTTVAERHQECEVTSLAQRSNALALDLPAGQWQLGYPEVALEVRCRTFLRNAAWSIDTIDRRLEITGLLVGANETPLELYARAGDVNVLYEVVYASQPCSPFRCRSENIETPMDELTPIQIDLVKGGVIWHRVNGQLRPGNEAN